MRVIPLEMESVQGRDLTTWGHGEHELVEVHGVGPLDAVVADVALLIGDIVEDERSHGWERVFNDKDQWRTGEELMRAHKSRSLRMGVDAERREGQGQGRALMGTESELELELEMQLNGNFLGAARKWIMDERMGAGDLLCGSRMLWQGNTISDLGKLPR